MPGRDITDRDPRDHAEMPGFGPEVNATVTSRSPKGRGPGDHVHRDLADWLEEHSDRRRKSNCDLRQVAAEGGSGCAVPATGWSPPSSRRSTDGQHFVAGPERPERRWRRQALGRTAEGALTGVPRVSLPFLARLRAARGAVQSQQA